MTAYPAPTGGAVPPDAAPTRTFRGRMRWDVLAELASACSWRRGAELGTADGRTAARLLRSCPALDLLVVDLWEPQPAGEVETWADWPHKEYEALARARLAPFGSRARIFKGTTAAAAETVPDGALDFVFIDADHSEAAVRADLEAWRPKVRAGGMLLLHDINWPGVRRAADDLMPGLWIGPNNVAGVQV